MGLKRSESGSLGALHALDKLPKVDGVLATRYEMKHASLQPEKPRKAKGSLGALHALHQLAKFDGVLATSWEFSPFTKGEKLAAKIAHLVRCTPCTSSQKSTACLQLWKVRQRIRR